jgi:multicomponent Na+:H+ antiporter subunit B
MRRRFVDFLLIVLFIVFVIGIFEMPTEASVNAPAYNEVVEHYISQGAARTNASNLIAGILADYRAFDTLGETIVLFVSVVAVGSVLRTTKSDKEVKSDE